MHGKFLAIRSELKKHQGSGTGLEDLPDKKFKFFKNLCFLEKHIENRAILSSQKLRAAATERETRPEAEKFAKKRQLAKDKIDHEIEENNKLLALAIKSFQTPQAVVSVGNNIAEKKRRCIL